MAFISVNRGDNAALRFSYCFKRGGKGKTPQLEGNKPQIQLPLYCFFLRGNIPFFISVTVINSDVSPTHALTAVHFFFLFSFLKPTCVFHWRAKRCSVAKRTTRVKQRLQRRSLLQPVCVLMARCDLEEQDVADCCTATSKTNTLFMPLWRGCRSHFFFTKTLEETLLLYIEWRKLCRKRGFHWTVPKDFGSFSI